MSQILALQSRCVTNPPGQLDDGVSSGRCDAILALTRKPPPPSRMGCNTSTSLHATPALPVQPAQRDQRPLALCAIEIDLGAVLELSVKTSEVTDAQHPVNCGYNAVVVTPKLCSGNHPPLGRVQFIGVDKDIRLQRAVSSVSVSPATRPGPPAYWR